MIVLTVAYVKRRVALPRTASETPVPSPQAVMEAVPSVPIARLLAEKQLDPAWTPPKAVETSPM